MRILTGHIVEGDAANHQIPIAVHDEPGSGGANHAYVIGPIDLLQNPSFVGCNPEREIGILFQNGPILEAGVNGLTHEGLLVILIDRLEGFQNGPYACDDNAEALEGLQSALACLQRRTRRRIEAGIEGTLQTDMETRTELNGNQQGSGLNDLPPIPGDEELEAANDGDLIALAEKHGLAVITREQTITDLKARRDELAPLT